MADILVVVVIVDGVVDMGLVVCLEVVADGDRL